MNPHYRRSHGSTAVSPSNDDDDDDDDDSLYFKTVTLKAKIKYIS